MGWVEKPHFVTRAGIPSRSSSWVLHSCPNTPGAHCLSPSCLPISGAQLEASPTEQECHTKEEGRSGVLEGRCRILLSSPASRSLSSLSEKWNRGRTGGVRVKVTMPPLQSARNEDNDFLEAQCPAKPLPLAPPGGQLLRGVGGCERRSGHVNKMQITSPHSFPASLWTPCDGSDSPESCTDLFVRSISLWLRLCPGL